jgi:hypothetical protein
MHIHGPLCWNNYYLLNLFFYYLDWLVIFAFALIYRLDVSYMKVICENLFNAWKLQKLIIIKE